MKVNINERLKFLDSLRGLAALIVVFHHFMVFNEKLMTKYFSSYVMSIFRFVSDLNVEAVLFFFVLSGFSIGLAQKAKWIDSRENLNFYLYKRFKRIIPIYILALLVSYITGLLIHQDNKPEYGLFNLLGNLAFLQTPTNATAFWFNPYGNNGPLWSLSYEMFFYLFFPFISYAIVKKTYLNKKEKMIWLLLIISSLIAIIINKYVFFIPYLAFLSLFIIWWGGFEISKSYLNRKKANGFWLIIFCSTTFILLIKRFIPSATTIEITKGLLIASLFYFALQLNNIWQSKYKDFFKRIFNFIFNRIGHGSYALYALHYPIFIYFSYLKLTLLQQLIYILLFILLCPVVEKWTIKYKFSFLKITYIKQ